MVVGIFGCHQQRLSVYFLKGPQTHKQVVIPVIDINPRSVISPFMQFITILSLILSFLAIYGDFYNLRLLLPRNVVPSVSKSYSEATTLLEQAEAINIPNVSDYRASLAILRNEFLQMRTDSHRSPGIFQQLYLLFPFGLTWRLYDLKWRIDAIRRSIELAVDERQLLNNANNANSHATSTALPASTTVTVIPMNIDEPTPPARAVTSTLSAA